MSWAVDWTERTDVQTFWKLKNVKVLGGKLFHLLFFIVSALCNIEDEIFSDKIQNEKLFIVIKDKWEM